MSSPQRCSISGCRTNHDSRGPFLQTFSLPRNETLRKLWLRHIPSELHRMNPVVCINHFSESAIIRNHTTLVNGHLVMLPREKPKLKENSYPTILPGSYGLGGSESSVYLQSLIDEDYGRHWLPQGAPGVPTNPLELPPNPAASSILSNPSMRSATVPGFIPLSDQIRARNNHPSYMQSLYGGYQPKLMGLSNPTSCLTNQSLMPPMTADVKLKKLPFYDHLGELLKTTALRSAMPAVREGSANFVFFLTPKQASEVSMNREVGPGTRNEYTVQVQLRFCLLDSHGEQDDLFPPGLTVKVNGKLVQLPNPVPTNKQGVEPKRPPRPLNISHMVKLCPSVANNLIITWAPDYQRGFCATVNLVRKLSSMELLDRLKAKSPKNAETTRNLIKEKLNDSDNDIATTVLRVSLSCPLGKMRMQTPCRSNTCNHLQCFDAGVFLSMNEKRPTWSCPVCNKPAIYDNLVIDGYFKEVLDSSLLGDSLEIELYKDGSWSPYDESKESSSNTCSLSTPSKGGASLSVDSPKADQIEEIDDDDDGPTSNGDSRVSSTTEKTDPLKEKEKEVVLVDLTDTDDDEPPPPVLPVPVSVTKEIVPPPVISPLFSEPPCTITRTDTSIINLDSPSPSPPLPNYSLPASGVVSPSSNYVCHLRMAPESRFQPY